MCIFSIASSAIFTASSKPSILHDDLHLYRFPDQFPEGFGIFLFPCHTAIVSRNGNRGADLIDQLCCLGSVHRILSADRHESRVTADLEVVFIDIRVPGDIDPQPVESQAQPASFG